MNAQEFVSTLNSTCPDQVSLSKTGYTNEEIDEITRSYMIKQKVVDRIEQRSVIEDLIHAYDVSLFEIGMVTFWGSTKQHGLGLAVGAVEADLLVLKTDEMVVVAELHHPEHILWMCADNGSSFLAALAHFADYSSKRMTGVVDYDDTAYKKTVVDKCAQLAGGERYRNFYSMLAGED
jgi:hypothetical protein